MLKRNQSLNLQFTFYKGGVGLIKKINLTNDDKYFKGLRLFFETSTQSLL